MMNTKSVAMLMIVMMVIMGMENILVQANRPLCELSGRCVRSPSPSPLQDHSSFDSDPSSESLSSYFGHMPKSPLCELSGKCARSPSPSPSQDHTSFDADLSSEFPSSYFGHMPKSPLCEFSGRCARSPSPSPSQDHSSFDSDPFSKSLSSYFSHTSKSPAPFPSSDFTFDLSPNSIAPSPNSEGNMLFCKFGFSLHRCSHLGKDPKNVEKFKSCMEKHSDACMKKVIAKDN